MNRYMMIRGLRRPAILLLIGGVWLLRATGVINNPWHWFVSLLLILLGVFMLAERAALAAEGGYQVGPYPGQPYPEASNPNAATGIPAYPGQPTAQAPPSQQDSEGGQS